jgi:hypothetical protein
MRGKICTVRYQETDRFQIARGFLNAAEGYYRHLLAV